jgi:hypothetical protein
LSGNQIPQMADLALADAMDAAKALFHAVGVPGQVVIDHEVGVLQVDALARRVGGQQAPAHRGCCETLPAFLRRSSRLVPPWMVTTAASLPSVSRMRSQVVQRVAVLGEDDDLATAAVRQ